MEMFFHEMTKLYYGSYWLVDWENYEGRIDNQDMLMFMVKSVSPVSSVVVTELLLSPQFIRIFPLCLCVNQQ